MVTICPLIREIFNRDNNEVVVAGKLYMKTNKHFFKGQLIIKS